MYSAFNFGRAYQLGRSHAVYEMNMLSTHERETTDSILVYIVLFLSYWMKSMGLTSRGT